MRLLHLLVLFSLACANCLTSCNSSTGTQAHVASITDTTNVNQETRAKSFSSDSAELTAFIRDFYKWKETKSSLYNFIPKSDSQDSFYIGIDWVEQDKRQKELEATNYFSKEFLDNYTNIAKTIDNRLKDGSYNWLAGELPPFGNDANPWCNCQDFPDDYWRTLTVSKINRTNGDVTFVWTFDNLMYYRVVATKSNGSWKIKYLQGFDYKEFLQ